MRTKRVTVKLAAMAIGLAAVMAATPAAAAPEQVPADAGPAASEECANGQVWVKPGLTKLAVRQWPSPTAPIWESYDGGQSILCIEDRYSLGERYTVHACNAAGANGYLIVRRGFAPVGYVFMMCVND